jgi:hypothetical protein
VLRLRVSREGQIHRSSTFSSLGRFILCPYLHFAQSLKYYNPAWQVTTFRTPSKVVGMIVSLFLYHGTPNRPRDGDGGTEDHQLRLGGCEPRDIVRPALIALSSKSFFRIVGPEEAQVENAQVGNPNTSQTETNRCTDH